MELMEGLLSRRSIRRYTDEPVTDEQLTKIVEAGTWAPSGLNNQPWRFVIVTNQDVLDELAEMTKYRSIIKRAPSCIVVFIDTEAMYHEIKDHQSIGACHQNILLAAHSMGLGAVWLGEILKNAGSVRELLGMPDTYQLMSVITVGHPKPGKHESTRKPLDDVLIKKI